MLNEDQIISKLKELKQIKPDSDWVYLTKLDVFGAQRPKFSFASLINEIKREERFVFSHKMAFSALTVFIAVIGVFGFALSSVPGDSLFQLKKMTEYGQLYFVSSANQPKYNLELADKRLNDLTKIAESNKVDKLAPAINEYQESKTNAVKSLIKSVDSGNIEELKSGLQEIEMKENQVKSLGVELGQNEELDKELAPIVKKEILERESAGLTEEELEILTNVKSEYEQGNYSKALELLLLK